MSRQDAWITGLGIVSPIGIGKQAFLEALLAGRRNLGPLRGIDVEGFRIGAGGEVDIEGADGEGRAIALTMRAAGEALVDAGIDLPDDATISVGTGAGEMRAMEASLGPPEAEIPDMADPLQPPSAVTAKLAQRLGLHGRTMTFVNACAAGAQAVGVAADLIRAGRADVALAGGVEIINRMVLSGFEALRAVSAEGPRPFDAGRDGIQLSELAALVVLESTARVEARGVKPYARLSGSGVSADGFHVVRPDERGAGAVLALERALADASLTIGDIDYVNAHGTGTPQNDPAELAALATLLGERFPAVPISSTKSMLGHALGASGAAEVVICALAIREGFIPPTLGFRTPIEGFERVDVVPDHARRGVELRHVLSSAFAFGGNNVALVLSAPN